MDKKYYIETYGYQMNVYDSELIENQLIKSGYHKTNKIQLILTYKKLINIIVT